jgi:hypothetical protein
MSPAVKVPSIIDQLNTVAINTQQCVVRIADLHTMLSSRYNTEHVAMEMNNVFS